MSDTSLQPGEAPPAAKGGGRNLSLAIVTGLALAGVIFALLFTTRIGWDIFIGLIVTTGLYEFYSVVKSKGYAPATVLGVAAAAAMMGGAAWRGPKAISFVLVLFVIGTFLWYLADSNRTNMLGNMSVTILGAVYTGMMGAYVQLMRDLPHGPAITISYIGLVAFYDIGAFASGSLFGKHKMAPAISPGKSWEGTAGATLIVFAIALGAGPFIKPWTLGSAVALAAAICVVAPIGDLAESIMKRDIGVKDFGHLLPGHGGMLDRIDALIFAAPVTYWIARWLLV